MKKQPTENQGRDSYQTGRTKPPKSYQGIIAVLLILVIFLGGIVSGLSLMNIRLFQMLEEQKQDEQKSLLQFSRQADTKVKSVSEGVFVSELGLTGQEVTKLCRSYYGWPEGLYISNVAPGGAAEEADLRHGDILSAIDGITVETEAALCQILSEKKAGDRLLITVFRSGNTVEISLTLD